MQRSIEQLNLEKTCRAEAEFGIERNRVTASAVKHCDEHSQCEQIVDVRIDDLGPVAACKSLYSAIHASTPIPWHVADRSANGKVPLRSGN